MTVYKNMVYEQPAGSQLNNNRIDLIRGISMIMVFFVHYGQSFGNSVITQFGQMGCQMFIFCSGYTCTCSIYRSESTKKFLKKRLLSLVPGFYTMLIATVILNIATKRMIGQPFVSPGNTSILPIICNLLLLQGLLPFCNNNVFGGAWFIGTIFILYLLHPIIDKGMKKTQRKRMFVVLAIVGSCLMTVILFNGEISNNSFPYYFFTNQLGCYLLGIYLFYYEKEAKSCEFSRVTITVLLGVCVFCSIVLFYGNYRFSFVILPQIMGLATFFLYHIIRLSDGCLAINTRDIITKVGKNSYYIFLTHVIVVWPIVRIMKKVLIECGIMQKDLYLFFILLIPSLALVFLCTIMLKKIVLKERILINNSLVKNH